MKINPREVAVCILTEILSEGGYNNVVLRRSLDEYDDLSSLDKAFITQIVNGTIKNMRFIDYIISKFSKIKLNKMEKDPLNILRSGVYQLYFMDRVPESAVCNEAVNVSKNLAPKYVQGFINGVLRNIVRSKGKIEFPQSNTNEYLEIMYSYPKWIIDMWTNEYDYDTVLSICQFLNSDPEVNICVNTTKISVDDLVDLLESNHITVKRGKYVENNLRLTGTANITVLEEYKKGYFHVQDESSMIAIEVLSPKEGEHILDICAAPGGKSFFAAIKMKNQGEIISGDIYDHKLNMIKDGADRLGLSIIKPIIQDATIIDEEMQEKFDKIIVDAPCSGLGIVRKKPDIKFNRTPKDIEELIKLQRDILKTASNYLKSGGILIYSTCTLSKCENIDNVNWFIENFDFEMCDMTEFLPNSLKCHTAKQGYIELLPHIYNTDGFFIARLKKK
ncbi:MAG: 16S rRNA (cytosine(967)-C(5))-methyltransferase [Clostridiales bacterium GWD2_32_19]|nr:MAG: 16S rRNA (cytosine(967)-C(5))-methyltransferase [Clostridiales bacterium GWD2_32_19]